MRTIMVVDDDPAVGRLAKLGLESTGAYTVFAETLGARVVETARKCRPELILLDVMMPDVDGADVAVALEEDFELRHIKVVFLTALLRKGEETKSGKHNVVAKPVCTSELVAIIGHELGQRISG